MRNPVIVRLLLMWLLFAMPGLLPAQTVAVEQARDLATLGARAEAEQLPILLFFSAEGCHYCHLLEEEILHPMLRNGSYEGKRVLMRRVMIDDATELVDFNGTTLAVGELQGRYRVYVTPTLVFIDGSGRELAEKMVGINTPELFGGYLDEAVEQAATRLRRSED